MFFLEIKQRQDDPHQISINDLCRLANEEAKARGSRSRESTEASMDSIMLSVAQRTRGYLDIIENPDPTKYTHAYQFDYTTIGGTRPEPGID